MAEAGWIIDFHCDTLTEMMRNGGGLERRAQGHLDAARLRQAGVRLQVFAVFSNPKTQRGHLADALAMIELFWQAVDAKRIAPVLWRSDLQSLPARPGGMLSLEGGEPLGVDLRLLQLFFRLGVRAVGLTWNGRNALADGVGEADSQGGLTSAGKAMVAEMNRLGMLVDVSHLSPAGFWSVIECSAKPIIASHSNCRAICDHARNLTDEQLKAIAQKGGVVGLNFLPAFLNSEGAAGIPDVLRHAEHMLSVMGRGHVGLGSDFDGIAKTPVGLEDVSCLPRLHEVLAARFGAEIAAEIMGGSFAQLLAEQLPERPADTDAP